MKRNTLFVLFIVQLSSISRADLDGNNKQGNFESKDGSKCVWFELREKVTETILTLACHCRSEDGEMQSFSCQYEGDLSECQAYREDSQSLYEDTTKFISEHQTNGCEADEVVVEKCNGFKLRRIVKVPQKAPCVRDQRREEL